MRAMVTDSTERAERGYATASRGAVGGPAELEQHLDLVLDDVAVSWRRSADDHHIDPAGTQAPHVQTAAELSHSREPIEGLIRVAQSELDRVYGVVRRVGYVVLLCDNNGVAVEYRGNDARSAQFSYWGVWVGGVLAPASRSNAPLAYIRPSTSARGTARLVAPVRRCTASTDA
jgi:transcriptional regulator of acetoin/glycerol metabolism